MWNTLSIHAGYLQYIKASGLSSFIGHQTAVPLIFSWNFLISWRACLALEVYYWFLVMLTCIWYGSTWDFLCTHQSQHTLDLMISKLSDSTFSGIHIHDAGLSDHYAVHCVLPLSKPPREVKVIVYRKLCAVPVDIHGIFFKWPANCPTCRYSTCKIIIYLKLLTTTTMHFVRFWTNMLLKSPK